MRMSNILLNTTVVGTYGVRNTEGKKFGLELELEGAGVGLADVATVGWHRKHDGSLRGESIEYVFSAPTEYEKSRVYVDKLFEKFKAHNVKFNNSIRTSTHVHMNFADKPMKQALNFFCLFTMLEAILEAYSGEDRSGNLFCLSSRRGEEVISALENNVRAGNLRSFHGTAYKYAACNLCTLHNFGTVELRLMRGADTAQQVNDWLSICNDMYVYACDKMVSPTDLVVKLSHIGAHELMREIFQQENYDRLSAVFPKVGDVHRSLLEGVRLIQGFAYEFDEDFRKPLEMPKPAKAKAAVGQLRYDHNLYIYRAGGGRWRCHQPAFDRDGQPHNGFLNDGDILPDARRVVYSVLHQRFVENGQPLNWRKHPVFGDEGDPNAMPDWAEEVPDDDEI